MGDGSIITERAAASPGAAQKSMEGTVGVEEEEVIRRIQTRNSTTNTSNSDTAKSKDNKKYDLDNCQTMKYRNKKCKPLIDE